MKVLSIYDLNAREALQASLRMRLHARNVVESPEAVKEVISMVGGRLSYLSRISKARNMMDMAEHLLRTEKGVRLISLTFTCEFLSRFIAVAAEPYRTDRRLR